MHDRLYRYYHMGDAKGDPNMVVHTRIDSSFIGGCKEWLHYFYLV